MTNRRTGGITNPAAFQPTAFWAKALASRANAGNPPSIITPLRLLPLPACPALPGVATAPWTWTTVPAFTRAELQLEDQLCPDYNHLPPAFLLNDLVTVA